MSFARSSLVDMSPRPAPARTWSAIGARLYSLVLDFALDRGCAVRRLPRVAQGLQIERDGVSVRIEVIAPDEDATPLPGRFLVRSLDDFHAAARSAGLALGAAA